MTQLLDYIFYNLEERDLDRNQLESYIRYLEELIQHNLPPEKKIAYQNMKRQMLTRLQQLDHQ